MTSNNFNSNELAIIKLPKKIKLTDSKVTSVNILPCEVHQIPYLPEELYVIPKSGSVIKCQAYGSEYETYFRVSEGIGVILSSDGKFYLYTPDVNHLPDSESDISYIQVYAMGEMQGEIMYVTHMYVNTDMIPESAKISKFDYYVDWTFITIFGILALAAIIAVILGYTWHWITAGMSIAMILPQLAEVKRVLWIHE